MEDLECPYCDKGQEVCHDDGFGYEENERHEMECPDCGKTFVFTTSIVLYYEPGKADCLNGSDHDLKMNACYPKEYSEMCCADCDYRRKPTPEEFAAAGIVVPKPARRNEAEGE